MACALQRARHGQLSGSLEDRERGRRDVGARVGSLALGQAYRAGDEGGRHDARHNEAKREDQSCCGRHDRDDTDRPNADYEGNQRRQEGPDHYVSNLVHVRACARHQIAAANTRQGGFRLVTQAVVEVGAQGIHAVESNPVRG